MLAPGGGGLFEADKSSQEQWTINCCHINATAMPDHQEYCNRLADMLKKVQGIRPNQVRVTSNEYGSTIYYGSYTKQATSDHELLVFPPEFTRDIELIRRMAYGNTTPFFEARPELMDNESSARGPWDVANAKGKYTLQIAVFYNTSTFHNRKEAAEKYVKILRDQGYHAYYRHEIVKSHVFVGDFYDADIIKLPNGEKHFGPAIEKYIAQNPEEFQYIHENGYLFKRRGVNGNMVAPFSYIVTVPRDGVYSESGY